MGLFCNLCDNKATHNYEGSSFAVYCERHKRDRMKKIAARYRPYKKSNRCMICNVDANITTLCTRCINSEHKYDKLIIKYIERFLPPTGLKLSDNNVVILINFKGNIRTRLLDLEISFEDKKVIAVNFLTDNYPSLDDDISIDDLKRLHESLDYGLELLKACISKNITESEMINLSL